MNLFAAPFVALLGAAQADDLEAAAKQRMKLSNDYEQLDGLIQAAYAAPAEAMSAGIPQARLPLEPNSTVDTVTIFGDRALVTRVRTLELGAGPHSVSFTGLPLALQDDSLHAELRAGGAVITGVERASGASEVPEEKKKALEAEARAVGEQLGAVQDRIAALLAQRAYLRASLLQGGESQPQPALATVRANLDFVAAAEAEIARKLRAEEDKARELDEQLTPLLARIQDPEAAGVSVTVDLDNPKAGSVTVALSYQVWGAGWSPSYNARLSPDGKEVELAWFGVVSQQTGEIWKDATLLLSTADPNVSGELPRLEPWYLGRNTYSAYGGGQFMDNMAGATGFIGDETGVQASIAPAPMSQTATLDTAQRSGGAVVFAIPGRRTVTGDGSTQRLPVGVQRYPVATEYAATPRLVPEVYRRGRLTFSGSAPLLPGQLSTFVGGDFVGTDTLETTVPGEELVLSFGTDDRFKVERQLVSREIDHPGAGRKTVRYTFHFRIKVTNYGSQAARVMVTDQIPVSEVDKVVVKLLETTPPLPADAEDPAGVLKWGLDLAPGKDSTIDLRFSVTGPADDPGSMNYQELEMTY